MISLPLIFVEFLFINFILFDIFELVFQLDVLTLELVDDMIHFLHLYIAIGDGGSGALKLVFHIEEAPIHCCFIFVDKFVFLGLDDEGPAFIL